MAILLLALSLTLALPAAGSASHRPGNGGPRDFAVGGGFTGSESNDPLGAQHVGFAAVGESTAMAALTGADDPVSGHFRAGGELVDPPGSDATDFQQEGPVTCLVVEPPDADGTTRARLVYPIKQARPEANEANEVLIFLEDNGRPRNGEPVDEIGFAIFPDETPGEDPPSEQDGECLAPTVSPVMSKLTRGDFTLHDAG